MLADPARYAALEWATPNEYALGEGRYLMLGDNSPWSRDGRAWGRADQKSRDDPGQGWDDSGRERWEVPESLIIGKAFWVYWPHAKPVWPMIRLGADFRFPARALFRASSLDSLGSVPVAPDQHRGRTGKVGRRS